MRNRQPCHAVKGQPRLHIAAVKDAPRTESGMHTNAVIVQDVHAQGHSFALGHRPQATRSRTQPGEPTSLQLIWHGMAHERHSYKHNAS